MHFAKRRRSRCTCVLPGPGVSADLADPAIRFSEFLRESKGSDRTTPAASTTLSVNKIRVVQQSAAHDDLLRLTPRSQRVARPRDECVVCRVAVAPGGEVHVDGRRLRVSLPLASGQQLLKRMR